MNCNQPAASAIITVFNEQEWIRAAIDSLLNQTFRDLEIVVVDDGSDDETPLILASIDDTRLRIVSAQRIGRAAALQRAVRLCRGEFIANLDADDECYPERLEKQVGFLRSHQDHGWVGGAEDRHDSQRQENYLRFYPESDDEIRRMSAKCIPYCHSAVMFRRSIIDSGTNYLPAQPYLIDFEFFLRVAAQCKVANLPIPVVKRRARGKSYFQRSFSTQEQNRELSRLCRKARRQFQLPLWMEVYPLARSIYPFLPNFVKQGARHALGLREVGSDLSVPTGER